MIDMTTLHELMYIDDVIYVAHDGTVTDELPSLQYAPELYIETADDGGIYSHQETAMIEAARAIGWEIQTGWSHEYAYDGAILPGSQYIGGGLEDHIRATPGYWVATVVYLLHTDDDECVGWVVAHKEAS